MQCFEMASYSTRDGEQRKRNGKNKMENKLMKTLTTD